MFHADIEFTERYGGRDPDPDTMCRGQCEGTGTIPVNQGETDPVLRALWKSAHVNDHDFAAKLRRSKYFGIRSLFQPNDCDGWHFVPCPTCGGSGKREEV